jgi:hypothetical protein
MGTVDFESSGFVQHTGTGNLNINAVKITQSSRINFSAGDRNYTITRTSLTELAQVNLSGTGAGIADTITDTNVNTRSIITMSATGGAPNGIIYCNTTGVTGGISINGTSSGQTVDRCNTYNGQFTVSNCTVPTSYLMNSVSDGSTIQILNTAVSKGMQYCTATGLATISVTGAVAGTLSYSSADTQSTINISGTCGSATHLVAMTGSIINANGGAAHQRIYTDSGGAITTGNFSQTNIALRSPVGVTCTVANTNRATYLGLVSALPIV